jgi:hypothetical protein
MKLYEINREMEELLDQLIDNETGEINEEVEARLNELKVSMPDAIEDFAVYIKDEVAMLKAMKDEKAALSDRISALENKIDRHKESLARYTNGEAFKGARAAITYRKTESVQIDENADLQSFPAGLVEVETKYKPIKAEIKAYIKEGNTLDGASIVEGKSMSIK